MGDTESPFFVVRSKALENWRRSDSGKSSEAHGLITVTLRLSLACVLLKGTV